MLDFFETLRNKDQQSLLIPLPIWKRFFNGRLMPFQRQVMGMDPTLLASYIETIDVQHIDDSEKAACWLAIAFSHPEIDDETMIRFAEQLEVQPASIFMAAAAYGRLSLLEGVTSAYGNPSYVERIVTYFGQPQLFKRLIGHYSMNIPELLKYNRHESFCAAAENGHLEVLEYLSALDPSQVKSSCFAAFPYAAEYGQVAVVKRIYALYPEVAQSRMAENEYMVTLNAVKRGDEAMLNCLLEFSPPNARGVVLKQALSSANKKSVDINTLLRNKSSPDAAAREAYIPSAGPLPKNLSTVILLHIVQCCLLDPQAVIFEADNTFDEIIVKLPNSTQYNLSLLLRHADLTQVVLSNDLLQKYEAFLSRETTIHKPDYETINPEGALRQLHPASMSAINIYTTGFYRIINQLCRGQMSKDMVKLLELPSGNEFIMEALFVGLFSAHGLTTLHELQVNHQSTVAEHPHLYRRIEQSPTAGVYLREQANVSTSITSEGSLNFVDRDKLVLVEENRGYTSVESISQDPREKEITFPSGIMMLYTPISTENTVFSARVVYTPEILDAEGHQALTGEALRYAFVNFLNKPYSGQTTSPPRPNHGIVHVIKTLAYVDMIIDYFMQHAKAEYRPYFYPLDSLKTKLLLVFYSSGRDSEVAFNEDPELYREYRKQSVRNFNQYLHDVSGKYAAMGLDELTWSKDEIRVYSEILEHAGNPIYLQDLIENLPMEPTNGFKIALLSVLEMSSCLDLARCFNADEYDAATKFNAIIAHNSEQEAALTMLRSFALQAIQATDDHCLCQLSGSRLTDAQMSGRGKIFADLSIKIKDCEQVIQLLEAEQNMVANIAAHAPEPRKGFI